MFWIIYIASSIIMSLIIARISKEYFDQVFICFLILFITPAQILTSTSDYAPSLFTFIFNVIFEQNFSTRVLKPLLLSIPISIFSLSLYLLFKRKLS